MRRNNNGNARKKGSIILISTSRKDTEDTLLKLQKYFFKKGYIVMDTLLPQYEKDESISHEDFVTAFENIKKKIRICDILYVVDNYVSDKMKEEIRYAKSINKPIYFLNDASQNMYKETYGVDNNITEKSWDEFRDTGLLLQVNQILHNFGFAIVTSYDREHPKNFISAYPARVKFRGFGEQSIDKSYNNVAKYLKENIDDLMKDLED